VGLDEKSFLRGPSHVSLMTVLVGRLVLEVVPGRDTQSGLALRESSPPEQRSTVEAAAMDMGAPFIAGTRQTDIIHDRFHISKPFNEAVDHGPPSGVLHSRRQGRQSRHARPTPEAFVASTTAVPESSSSAANSTSPPRFTQPRPTRFRKDPGSCGRGRAATGADDAIR
jgi:hypothetical protein